MAEQEKKMAAALAAVSAYLQQEEEALHRQLAAAMAPAGAQMAAPPQNLWGQSGRQNMMQLRSMMQLKGFHRVG